MNKIVNFLSGTRILEEVESPINGKITVVNSLAWGTYIQVENLTQSGGILEGIWKKTLKKVTSNRLQVTRCLVLGLGGGSAAKVARDFWPEAKITGVDIDPIMVGLGKKYLGLDEVQVKVQVQDAFEFLTTQNAQPPIPYDLILVDLYVGRDYPEKFESENYIRLVRTVLASNGVAVFNRLYFDEKRLQAVKFGKKLEKIFTKVDCFYPQANLMFICRS